MTVKKKVGISDLLRDEVQKGTELVTNNELGAKTIEVKAETIADLGSQVAGQPTSNAIALAPSDRAKIATLESELARSQKHESEQVQVIADLQKDLKSSQTNIELLQKSLAAIEILKNELERQLVEVKRDNLRLAEANIQLSGQISEHNQAAETTKAPPVEAPSASQLVPQNTQNNTQNNNRATPRKQPVDQPYPNRDRTPYARPTGSNEQLQRINNKNIGWMD